MISSCLVNAWSIKLKIHFDNFLTSSLMAYIEIHFAYQIRLCNGIYYQQISCEVYIFISIIDMLVLHRYKLSIVIYYLLVYFPLSRPPFLIPSQDQWL